MKRLKKLSNRGSTFVVVITTIGFVGIVTSLVLMVTSASYQSKAIDNQAKNNFYSAEEIVDQVKTGLHNDMSKAIMSAYFSTLTSYRNLYMDDSISSAERTLPEWKESIYLEYRKAAIGDATRGFIKTITNNGTTGDCVYKDLLESYISEDYKRSKDRHVNIEVGIQKNTAATSVMTYEYDATEFKYITIKNIGIRYTNELGYTNSVFTDIRMDIPEITFDFLDIDKDMSFAEYALMSAGDVEYVANGSSDSTAIIGNFWVGNNFHVGNAARVQALSDYAYIGGILELSVGNNTSTSLTNHMFEMNILDNNNRLDHNGAYYNPRDILSSVKARPGSLALDSYYSSKYGRNKICFDDSYFAVGDILLDGTNGTSTINMLNSDTNLYVKNDMQFNVDNAKVDIYNLYKGYGYSPDDANSASAIILNNKNCKLNMDVRILSIMDTASIKTNADDSNRNYALPFSINGDVRTGDSLIVRGNQIAYLVPAAYVPQFFTNPVSTAEASAAGVSDLEGFAQTIASSLPGAIKDLCVPTKEVKPVFYSYTGNTGDYVAYYYLNFKTPADAVAYYDGRKANGDPVQVDGQEIVTDTMKQTLLGLIPAEINVNIQDMNSSFLKGHVLTHLSANTAGLTDPYTMIVRDESGSDDGLAINKQVSNMRSFLQKDVPKKFEDEKHPIYPDDSSKSLADFYKDRTAIENIIDWEKLIEETTDVIIHENNYDYDGTDLKIWVQKGDMNLNGAGSTYQGLFISAGNINVGNNVKVEGLCIAGYKMSGLDKVYGKITLGKRASLSSQPDFINAIYRDSAQFRTPKGVFFNEIFKGFEYDSTAHTFIPLEGDSIINLNDMFTYRNWSRQ